MFHCTHMPVGCQKHAMAYMHSLHPLYFRFACWGLSGVGGCLWCGVQQMLCATEHRGERYMSVGGRCVKCVHGMRCVLGGEVCVSWVVHVWG